MSISSISLIENPPFIIDFRKLGNQEELVAQHSIIEKITRVACRGLNFIKVVFVSIGSSAYVTLSHTRVSFINIVLGYRNDNFLGIRFYYPNDLPTTVLKISKWILSMCWCFITTTIRKTQESLNGNSANENILQLFANRGVNVSHIQSNELSIDVSHVPPNVTVNDLLNMFNEINFLNRNAPGYFGTGLNAANIADYKIADYKTDLSKFVKRVNDREAFLGTPPQYDTPRLMAFYQQIEDAVRFSIHKVNTDLHEFQQLHGENVEQYSPEILREYDHLLVARSQVVRDLANAGGHCGARYMGDSMQVYSFQATKNSPTGDTLNESLIKLLGWKRKEIAEQQIQEHFPARDTHDYGNYMSALGALLALPGTKNIIEHLRDQFDRNKYLKLFFDRYTDEFICDAVQNEIKKNQVLREQTIDWLKTQIGNWRSAGSERAIEEVIAIANPLLETTDLSDSYSLKQNFNKLQQLIAHLIRSNSPIPHPDQEMDEYLANLLHTEEANAWIQNNLSSPPETLELNQIQRKKVRIKNDIKDLFSDKNLGQLLFKKIRDSFSKNDPNELKLEDFSNRLLLLQKASQIRDAALSYEAIPISLSQDICMRIVKGAKPLREAIGEYLTHAVKDEFLEQLHLENMEQSGLPPSILEWILVANNILNPQ